MKISCVIPTCDRNKLLTETVKSVLNQILSPFEIIIVNNGRGPVDLPESLKSKVKIFDIIPYAGVSQARNFGASLAGGVYLAFIDDDDLWNENYLKNISEKFLAGAECVISRLDKMKDGKVSPFKNAFQKLDQNNILIQNPGITGSNIAVSKKSFFEVRGFDPILPPSEDKAFVLELLRAGKKVEVLPGNQAIIRMHGKERLSDAKKMAEGISQFTRKYRRLMDSKQYFFNVYKILKYQSQSGGKIEKIKYFLINIAYIFFKLFNKIINNIWKRIK